MGVEGGEESGSCSFLNFYFFLNWMVLPFSSLEPSSADVSSSFESSVTTKY